MKISVFFATLLLPVLSSAQAVGFSENRTFESQVFGKEREIKIHISDAVADSSNASYPILFVFDAQFDPYWKMVSETVSYLSAVNQFPHVITVGICTENRPREFTPQPEDGRTRKHWGDSELGGASLLTKHIRSEVLPLLESEFNVMPLSIGIGHSLGGTYVSNSVFENEELFQAVISISPNMVYDYGLLPQKLHRALVSGNVPRAWHFAGAGTVGDMEKMFLESGLKADSIYHADPHEALVWKFNEYPGLNHMNSPIHVISEGLAAFNQYWNITDEQVTAFLADTSMTYVDHLKGHYREMSDWVRFEIPLDSETINSLGYMAAYKDRWKEALPVFEWGIEAHPDDPNLYDSKGECLENLGDMEGALSNYAQAKRVLDRVRDRYTPEECEYYDEIFNINFERARAALSEDKSDE